MPMPGTRTGGPGGSCGADRSAPTVIKYLGSKRRLVPVLAVLARASGARSALDLFTGTNPAAFSVAEAVAQLDVGPVTAGTGRGACPLDVTMVTVDP